MELENSNQQQTPTQNLSQSQTFQNNFSNARENILLILCVVLLILLVANGAYFLGTQKNNSNSSYQTQQTVSPTSIVQSSPVTDKTTSSPSPLFRTEDTFVTPVNLKIDESCIDISIWSEANGQKIRVECESLGNANVGASVKILIKPKDKEKVLTRADNDFDVYLEFYDNGKKLSIPPYYFPSFANASISWFTLDVSYLDRNNTYISDEGGHESYPKHYFFDGKKWIKLSLWDLVKKDFPDTIQPPFSLEASSKYLKITEENYCCDVSYTSDIKDRKDYRLVYLLDRTTARIIEKGRVPR